MTTHTITAEIYHLLPNRKTDFAQGVIYTQTFTIQLSTEPGAPTINTLIKTVLKEQIKQAAYGVSVYFSREGVEGQENFKIIK